MSSAPSLMPPREGGLLNPELAYVKRVSAERQAAAWNQMLSDDPVLGPASGFVVGVGAKVVEGACEPDCEHYCAANVGRHPLVWVVSPTAATEKPC